MTKKRAKTGYSDALRAFMLVGVLVAFSASISLAVIMVHSYINNRLQSGASDTPEPEITVETEKPDPPSTEPAATNKPAPPAPESAKPAITVSVQQSAEKQTTAAPARTTPAVTKTAPSSVNTAPAAVPQRPPEKPIENLGTLVFVIDDAGNNLRELEPFLRIPGPLTIAVLPGLPHSAEAARRIRAAGKEVFLHQPMEAIGAQNPGPGAIYSNMNAEEIRSILRRNVAEVGPVAGINNHQGSKITMNREAVETILSFCAGNGLRFLDSRTTAETVVPDVARKLGITIGERNVFLDNEQNRESMLAFISNGLTRAQKNGHAVMIGHTWSPELAPLLAEQFPLLTSQGYSIKTVSDIIEK